MKNIPHLHAELHQFCMYGKHTTSTRRIGAILRVRRSLFSYTRRFCMYTSGLRFRFRLSMYTKHAQKPKVGLGSPRRRAGPCKEDYSAPNFFMKMARASSRPRWTSAFFVSSSSLAVCFFRDPALISAFSWSYF